MTSGKIGILDYGMGNISSIANGIYAAGGAPLLVSEPSDLISFDKLILPGVGAFGRAINILKETGLSEAIEQFKQSGKNILGICLGMQLMCLNSDENKGSAGFGWFPVSVKEFSKKPGLRVPHMGWNDVSCKEKHFLFDDIEKSPDFYFVHSFCVPKTNAPWEIGSSTYADEFISVIAKENLVGVQFHPEKSQAAGLKLLENFVRN